jgi:hypothetical protein
MVSGTSKARLLEEAEAAALEAVKAEPVVMELKRDLKRRCS